MRFIHQASFADAQIIAIDGLRVEFPHGWGLLRASNTTPCLIARFEANDSTELARIQNLFYQELHRLEPPLAQVFKEII